ncbi:MaoC family dehydratase [Achromobacter sp. GG226]|uniref:MaoC family dehydratase n=1 Tax=Verticiella alkaliphila TaxID=2779529 RepID=UPI001C0DFEA5|nr:MaoC family dehydratase [Verticiella sp. GG226]MBU4611713.1 MaoC family dehydratase [Verticiella sp. GG226]
MRVFESFTELESLVGQELATSDWLTIEQSRIDQFAQATGDHQWIHCDPKQAAEGPYGTTIAHGFLTLALLPALTATAYKIGAGRMGINYGLNKVRFPAPVPVGSKVRATFVLKALEKLDNDGMQLTVTATIEREGGDKPVCVAETLARRY